MQRVLSDELAKKIGEDVYVKGWLYNKRVLGNIAFLILRDRHGLLQLTITQKEDIKKLEQYQIGTVIYAFGKVQKCEIKDEKHITVEIIEPKIEIAVPVTFTSPIEYNKGEIKAGIEKELDYRPLSIRNLKNIAIFKTQAAILKAFGDSMRKHDFIEFRSPILMGTPSESGASVFEVNYFDGKAYLAQSPQLYKQIMLGAFERAFTITTVFRAEKHNTSRHIMELTQMDGEMAFIDDYNEVMDIIEEVMRDILDYLKENCSNYFQLLNVDLPKLPKGKFPKIKVKEALKIIEERTGKSSKREELDVDPEDERELGKWALEKYNSDFFWLINFKKDKNFYTWNNEKDPDESLSYDLEFKGLELLSGTHRIHLYDKLRERVINQGLTEENYEHYLQAFKYGMPPEAGFSFGLERMTKQLFNLENIREATLFPADLTRLAGAKRKYPIVRGGKNMMEAIKKLLESRAIEYKIYEHEEIKTSEDATKVRGISADRGIKSMILKNKTDDTNIMVLIPGNKKIDIKRIEEVEQCAFELEKPEKIKEKFGIEVGGVPPFGNLLGMKVYSDQDIQKNKDISFNCGLKTCSIDMKSSDLIEVVDGIMGNWSK